MVEVGQPEGAQVAMAETVVATVGVVMVAADTVEVVRVVATAAAARVPTHTHPHTPLA